NGEGIRSCVTPISRVGEQEIITIEAIGESPIGKALQKAWTEVDVPQCGYCQSGQIMAATILLRENGSPNNSDIDDAMCANICRCGTYQRIRKAIHMAADSVSNG